MNVQHPSLVRWCCLPWQAKKGPLSAQYRVLIEYTGHHVANVLETAEQIKKGHVCYRTEQDDRAKYSICTFTNVHGDTHMGSIQKFIVNP